MKTLTPLILLSLVLSGAVQAGGVPNLPTQIRTRSALSGFRQSHGSDWFLRIEPSHGYGRFLAGGRRVGEYEPQTAPEWISLAELRLQEAMPMLGVDPTTLDAQEVQRLDLRAAQTTDKVSVTFQQKFGGIPVVGGTVTALFLTNGDLVAVDSQAIPGSPAIATSPLVGYFDATDHAVRSYRDQLGAVGLIQERAELVIWPHKQSGLLKPRLAWSVWVRQETDDPSESAEMRIVVAADDLTKEILHSQQTAAHQVSVGQTGAHNPLPGTIEGTARTGSTFGPNGQGPVSTVDLPDASVLCPIPDVFTDTDGLFTIDDVSTTNLGFGYSGQWADVTNALAAGDYELWQTLFPRIPATVTLNPSPSGFPSITSQANVYLGVDRFHGFVKSTDPSETRMDFPMAARANASNCAGVNSPCYSPTGGPGGTPILIFLQTTILNDSTAGTVVAHEAGHWANVLFGNGMSLHPAFNEAVADTWAMYVWDTPGVGVGAGYAERFGTNTAQFCGDGNTSGCVDTTAPFDPHLDGQVLMGALWKVRAKLNASLGNTQGDATANRLFLGWLQVFNDLDIAEIIEDHWLVIDDNDGNLNNGTPHFTQIDDAFVEQGFSGWSPPGPVQNFNLHAADAGANDEFGYWVAISGTTGIVGAPMNDDNGTDSGSAYLFNVSTGQQLFELHASDATAGDLFGCSVAISGNRAIVGAYDLSQGTGGAYVFDTTNGQQLFKLTPNDPIPTNWFGISVGLSGTTAIVGAQNAGGSVAGSGAAYLFNITNGQQTFKLNASDAAWLDEFGHAVAISGTRAIVGAHGNDDAGASSGSAYVFSTTNGQQLFKLTASDAASLDYFGVSVSISGTTAVVGAHLDDGVGADSGSAYVFNATTGQQLFKLTASDPAAGDWFGSVVSVSGTTAIVGAFKNDDGGADSGSAYLFSTTTGQQIYKILASDDAAGDSFGYSVAHGGTRVLVGASGNDDIGSASGSAYVFTLP